MKCINCRKLFKLPKRPAWRDQWRGFKLGRFVCTVRCSYFLREANKMDANAAAIVDLEAGLGQRVKTFKGNRWYQALLRNRAWYKRYLN